MKTEFDADYLHNVIIMMKDGIQIPKHEIIPAIVYHSISLRMLMNDNSLNLNVALQNMDEVKRAILYYREYLSKLDINYSMVARDSIYLPDSGLIRVSETLHSYNEDVYRLGTLYSSMFTYVSK